MIPCKQCKMEFEPEHSLIKFCSNVCRALSYHQHNRNAAAARTAQRRTVNQRILDRLPQRMCPVCREPFRPRNFRQHICSDRCRGLREEAKLQEWVERYAKAETNNILNKDAIVVAAMAAAHEAKVEGEDSE